MRVMKGVVKGVIMGMVIGMVIGVVIGVVIRVVRGVVKGVVVGAVLSAVISAVMDVIINVVIVHVHGFDAGSQDEARLGKAGLGWPKLSRAKQEATLVKGKSPIPTASRKAARARAVKRQEGRGHES